jgi:hypothetical protein
MSSITDDNFQIFYGLYKALSRTYGSARIVYFKVIEAQNFYYKQLPKDSILPEQQETATILLNNAMHKFLLASYSLEQLWGCHGYLKFPERGLPITDTDLTTSQNDLVFLLSALFDQTLYNWRSFLDFYLKYLLFFCTNENIPTMSTRKFKNAFERHIDTHIDDEKSKEIFNYIKQNVLGQTLGGSKECWGDLLKSLRDKTTHQKIITPTIVKQTNSTGYTITWPTINGKNYAELAQWNFENSSFDMIRHMFPLLYQFDWVTGPYKPGIYGS